MARRVRIGHLVLIADRVDAVTVVRAANDPIAVNARRSRREEKTVDSVEMDVADATDSDAVEAVAVVEATDALPTRRPKPDSIAHRRLLHPRKARSPAGSTWLATVDSCDKR